MANEERLFGVTFCFFLLEPWCQRRLLSNGCLIGNSLYFCSLLCNRSTAKPAVDIENVNTMHQTILDHLCVKVWKSYEFMYSLALHKPRETTVRLSTWRWVRVETAEDIGNEIGRHFEELGQSGIFLEWTLTNFSFFTGRHSLKRKTCWKL